MGVEVREEALRRQVGLPESATRALAVGELGVRQGLVELGDPVADTRELGLVDPDAGIAPVDLGFKGEDAVGVDQRRDRKP